MQTKVSISSFFKGKYSIKECIKKNAFSGVYVVENKSSKKYLLKVIHNSIANEEVKRRFKREAKILSKLKHKNIVKIAEYGFEKEISFIAFEYFESNNLREYLKNNPLSIETKYFLTAELFEGLNYLHKNKIVHRDLKPENILVNSKNELKITDFGLSLLLEDEFETKNQSIVGTPSYMSPEQIHGKRLTFQSDLFSIGSVVFEIFTSKNLFRSDDFNRTINNIINFSLSTIENYENELPHDIIRILKKLLAVDISKRAKNIEEVINILAEENHISKTNSKHISTKGVLSIAAVALLVFLYLIIPFPNNNAIKLTPVKTNGLSDSLISNTSANKKIDSSKTVENINAPDKEKVKESIKEKSKIITHKPKTAETKPLVKTEKTKEILIDTYPWSEVFLNDSSLGTTPLENKIKLKYSTYTFAFAHPGFPIVKKRISISDTSSGKYVFTLLDEFGYFNCKVFPWATISIDGKIYGDTPFEDSLPLLPGKHMLEVRNPSFPKYSKNIFIEKKDTTLVSLNLVELTK